LTPPSLKDSEARNSKFKSLFHSKEAGWSAGYFANCIANENNCNYFYSSGFDSRNISATSSHCQRRGRVIAVLQWMHADANTSRHGVCVADDIAAIAARFRKTVGRASRYV
jgi:hypothetical protein